MTTKATVPTNLELSVTSGGAIYVTDNRRFSEATFVVRLDSEDNRYADCLAVGPLFAAAPTMFDLLAEALPCVEESEQFNKPQCRNLSKRIRALIAELDGKVP